MVRYRALRGMKDILPADVPKWHLTEGRAREVFGRYGFREIRTPVMESFDLFARSVGELLIELSGEVFADERMSVKRIVGFQL